MFKKLRRNLLITNIVILSLFLFTVFGILFLQSRATLEENTDRDLERILEFRMDDLNYEDDQIMVKLINQMFEGINMFTFVLEGDELKAYDSYSFIDIDYIYECIDEIEGDREGVIEVGGILYRFSSVSFGEYTKYGFVNIERERELLLSTTTTYIFIYLASVTIVGLISFVITNRSIQPVKESYEKQKEFVANASHELKTPLTVMKTNIDVLNTTNEFKNNKWIQYITKEIDRMTKLTKDLLYLAKTGENDQFVKTNFDCSYELESILLSAEALMYEHNLTLETFVEEDVVISYNKEQFQQLVLILIDNAIKYTPRGETIKVVLKKEHNIILTVTNTGIEINEEDQKRLFERFFKVDKSRVNNNSFGLGLSIASAITKHNHSELKLESKNNETSFSVIIKK